MLPSTLESYFPQRLRTTSLPASTLAPPPTPMPSPVLTPVSTPVNGASGPRLLGRRSFTALSQLFSAGDDPTAGSLTSAAPTPPSAAATSSGGQYLQPSPMSLNGAGSGSSPDRRLVQFPQLVEDRRPSNGRAAREPLGKGSGGAGGATRGATLPQGSGKGIGGKVNQKKVRIAIRLLEELETESLAFNRHDEDPLEEDYIAHLLTLSLTSALASVPAEVQTRVFSQSPQLNLLPQPGFRFEFLRDEDTSWKERAADGLGKGVVWLWVSGLPVLLHMAACVAAIAGVVQAVLIRLRIKELLEFYFVVLLRFLATSPALEALRNVGADVTWVFLESLRRGLGGVMMAQHGNSNQRNNGKGGAR